MLFNLQHTANQMTGSVAAAPVMGMGNGFPLPADQSRNGFITAVGMGVAFRTRLAGQKPVFLRIAGEAVGVPGRFCLAAGQLRSGSGITGFRVGMAFRFGKGADQNRLFLLVTGFGMGMGAFLLTADQVPFHVIAACRMGVAGYGADRDRIGLLVAAFGMEMPGQFRFSADGVSRKVSGVAPIGVGMASAFFKAADRYRPLPDLITCLGVLMRGGLRQFAAQYPLVSITGIGVPVGTDFLQRANQPPVFIIAVPIVGMDDKIGISAGNLPVRVITLRTMAVDLYQAVQLTGHCDSRLYQGTNCQQGHHYR